MQVFHRCEGYSENAFFPKFRFSPGSLNLEVIRFFDFDHDRMLRSPKSKGVQW